ncbi:MAG: hypothetical protein QOE70_3765 [Chthoniobacter sp.]|jgi:copper chaperone CopZ|nr:hypothetical protein [Chthoniobacter sp.]
MTKLRALAVAVALLVVAFPACADEQTSRHAITGLFSPDRETDLRTLVEKIPGLKLVSIDFDNAEAAFNYDPAQLFPGAKPEQVAELLDKMLKEASRATFGIKPLSTKPRDQLTLVEIPVVGLDCKACGLAAYEAIAKIDGVERATASFKDGLVTARIDPAKTNRAALEEALKKKNVKLVEGIDAAGASRQ